MKPQDINFPYAKTLYTAYVKNDLQIKTNRLVCQNCKNVTLHFNKNILLWVLKLTFFPKLQKHH